MGDKYDKAIAYLTENPEEIYDAWFSPTYREGGDLFKFASPNGWALCGEDVICGCLTTIKAGNDVAFTKSLTKAIRRDGRIPVDGKKITPSDLPVFAEWQRRIDKELNRT